MTDLDRILRLRAMRETRAAALAAVADARLQDARAAHTGARAALGRHDAETARREEQLHDAMIAGGFTAGDLRLADDRALLSTSLRDRLEGDIASSATAAEDARAQAHLMAEDLRRAARRHEKLRLAARELSALAARRRTAIAEDEDTARHE